MAVNYTPADLGRLLSSGAPGGGVASTLGGGKAMRNLIQDPFFRTGAGEAFGLVGQRGAMDPRYLNAILGQIQRNTAADVDAFRTGAVQAGLGQSGMAQAIQAAIQNAGAQRQYQATAEDARLAEDRYRGDLDRLMGLLGLGRQEAQFDVMRGQQKSAQRTGRNLGYLGAATGGLTGYASLFG